MSPTPWQVLSDLNAGLITGSLSSVHIFLAFPHKRIGNNVKTFHELLESALEKGDRFNYLQIAEETYEVKLRGYVREISGYLIPYETHWRFFLPKRTGQQENIRSIASSFLYNSYPLLARARIKTPQLLSLIDQLTENAAKVLIREFTLFSYARKETTRKWGRKEYSRKEMQELLNREKAGLKALLFDYLSEGKVLFEVRIRRDGSITVYGGSQECLFEVIRLLIDSYLKIAYQNMIGFSNKERKIIREEVQIFPITYKIRDFQLSSDNIRTFVNFLKSNFWIMSKFGENPWAWLAITDKKDRSTYDIFIYEDEIKIIPFLRATPMSLSLLDEIITTTFPQAKIEHGWSEGVTGSTQ